MYQPYVEVMFYLGAVLVVLSCIIAFCSSNSEE